MHAITFIQGGHPVVIDFLVDAALAVRGEERGCWGSCNGELEEKIDVKIG